MMDRSPRRVIELNQGIFGSVAPRPKTIRAKRIAGFPGVPQVHLEVATKLASPLLSGPPLCDELVAFVQHLFTEEEAAVVQHLGQFAGKSASDIAKAEHLRARCIGCGLCVVACGDRRAVVMEHLPDYKLPYKSWFAYQFHGTAGMVKSAWKVWQNRLGGSGLREIQSAPERFKPRATGCARPQVSAPAPAWRPRVPAASSGHRLAARRPPGSRARRPPSARPRNHPHGD